MPVQELIDKLIKVGEEYPDKPTSILEKFKLWDKHDNQPAASELKSIKEHISSEMPEKLQEEQVLEALINILNSKDLVYSSRRLIPGIKAALSSYEPFEALDRYFPVGSDLNCPKIEDLRKALIDFCRWIQVKHDGEYQRKRETAKV